MAKSLVLGNGSMLVCLDHFGQVSDFYFPHVGLENHVAFGHEHKVGVFVDGQISWLSSPGWSISLSYEPGTMVSQILARHESLGVLLEFSDIVYNEKNIFLRHLKVTNLIERNRQIVVYFSQQFVISDAPRANTAYISGDEHKIIHYKGRRVFLVSGCIKDKKAKTSKKFRHFDQYSVGLTGIEGKEGTWRDAEDGQLSKNPIEHGAVDSVIGFTLDIGSNKSEELCYWIALGEKYKEVEELHKDIQTRLPEHFLESTRDYWHAWLEKRKFVFEGLSQKAADLFKTSLLVIRAHTDNEGAIIASGDSQILQYGRDTYSYVWPRDASFAALAMTKAGYFHIAERFFSFCDHVLTDQGFFLHKYNADRSFGSSWHPWFFDGRPQLAIQEDETALVLCVLWEYYEFTRDLEFIENIYNSLIKKAANFLAEYRDKKTGLPQPSYDLWEERHGIHCFTSAVVCGALDAAARFAAVLGKEEDGEYFQRISFEIRQAILDNFWNEKHGYFLRSLHLQGKNVFFDTTVDASSVYGIFKFNILPVDDPRLKRAFDYTAKALGENIAVGGLARYQGDNYFRRHENVPGNPWFIATLWRAEYLANSAKDQTELEESRKIIEWVAEHTHGAGMLSEQLDPETGEPVSASPLSWSHARYVLAVIAYLEKLEELGICKTCYPVMKSKHDE